MSDAEKSNMEQETGTSVATVGPTVEDMMVMAIQRGPEGVEALERLVALKQRMEDRAAEIAMAEALAAFQRDCPPVPRIRTAEVKKDGRKQYEYHFAPLEEIVRVIHPHLTAHGLSYTHDGEVNDGTVRTVCTLHHVAGARRTATFTGPIDASGGKNPIQQIGSARSYGRRYSLMDVLGLVTEDDDDGAGPDEAKPISDQQLADLQALMDELKTDRAKMLQHFDIESLADLPADRYGEAMQILEERRSRR